MALTSAHSSAQVNRKESARRLAEEIACLNLEPMSPPLLQIEALSKRYGKTLAVNDLNLSIPPGEIFALLGPNGAGKTTTIGCICGMVQPFEGSIRVAGYDVLRDYRITRQLVGVVPQELNFDGFFKVEDVVRYQAGFFGRRDGRIRARALLEEFRLEGKSRSNTRWLSGGMKRRLMICKALVHDPILLFLDEPTAGVDVELRDELWDYVRRLRDEGVTIVLTTHYLEEAEKLADRIGIIREGRIVHVDTTAGLKSGFGSQWLRLQTVEPIPANFPARLKPWNPCLEDNRTLHLSFPGVHEPDSAPVTAQILTAFSQAGLTIRHIEGGSSSLEDIFRQILHENAAPLPVPTL